MTPALLRLRAPFFAKNMIGLALATSIPLGVYFYTVDMLSKDEFSDIPIPPIADDELAKLKKEYEDKKNSSWTKEKLTKSIVNNG